MLSLSVGVDNGPVGNAERGGHVQCLRGGAQAHGAATGQTPVAGRPLHAVVASHPRGCPPPQPNARLQPGKRLFSMA